MHEDDFEVQFCDLCGTSVPLADLESGTAVRHQAKTIGACCLTVLRQGDSPLASPGAAGGGGADRAPAGAGRARSEGMLLPVAIALLAGMAGATIYLDLEIQGLADQQIEDRKLVATRLATTGETLDNIDRAMDGTARKLDIDNLRERVLGIDSGVKLHQEQVRQQSEALRKSLDAVQKDVARLEAQRIDYRPLFDDMRQQIVRANRAIAELRSAGETVDLADPLPPDLPAVEEPEPAPGLPEELATQVKRLADPDAAVRFEAVDQLLVSRNLAVLPYLIPMTQDADGFVRRLTVEGLRDFRHPDSVEALLDALGDGDRSVADTAWSSLKRLTGQKIAFDAASPSRDARARAQQRWRDWWEKNKDTFGT